jgi:hypothetical protein
MQKDAPERRIFARYSDAQIADMHNLLYLASNGRPPDMNEVSETLVDIVHGIGMAVDGAEVDSAWHEFADAEPRHTDMAKAFENAARSEDPISAALASDSVAARLSASIYNRWAPRWRRERKPTRPSIQSVDWASLSDSEQTEIRRMLQHLANFERQFVRKGRPRNTRLSTALYIISENYLQWTHDYQSHIWQLPYNSESRFIRFAHIALTPVGQHFETSPAALSRRWRFPRRVSPIVHRSQPPRTT